MPTRSQLQVAIGIAAAVWAMLLLIQGVALKTSYLRPYSLAVGVVIIVFLAFDRWLWRMRPFARFVRRPVVRGTWRGSLVSTWTDPPTSQQITPVEVYLVIRQTYSTVSVNMLTAESTSASLVGALDMSANAAPIITATYRNTPRLLVQDRSRIHHGALMLEVHGTPPIRLTGFYWTDRDTKGEIVFEQRTERLHTHVDDARADSYVP